MRIGIIGWYGHQNAGDERILYCLRRLFAAHRLLVVTGFEGALAQLPELNRCDLVVLGGGGLILRGCNRYAAIFESLKVPLVGLGLGIEA
ncbi:MAG TPA: hypothetical protein EYP56_17170, partial [Planctomycetaceae bacterium]|nr:hypothetical protein [Planctomycetaceae bacterium]